MNNKTHAEVQRVFEQFVHAFNTNDEYSMWQSFVWPYTEISGTDLIIRYKPVAPLLTFKAQQDWYYSQVISHHIQMSLHTAYVTAHMLHLDSMKQSIGESACLYVYKKIDGMWKIFVFSDSPMVDDAPVD